MSKALLSPISVTAMVVLPTGNAFDNEHFFLGVEVEEADAAGGGCIDGRPSFLALWATALAAAPASSGMGASDVVTSPSELR